MNITIRENTEVPAEMLQVWQRLLNLTAEVFSVPAALLMHVHAHEIEVFLRSENPENIYEKGDRARLDTGLYCETVMSSRKALLVPDARLDPEWDHNPDIKLGMVAYLGLPVFWPTGEVFGTMCVLDKKEHTFTETYVRLLEQLKNIIEHDLSLLDAQFRLRMSETRYRAMFNSVLDGIFVVRPDGWIADANEVARRQLGFSADDFTHMRITDVVQTTQDWPDLLSLLEQAGMYRGEAKQISHDGSVVPVDLHIVTVGLGDASIFVVVAHDISRHKALEGELDRLATTDSLTGIGNRRGFERNLAHAMTQANRYSRPLSLAMLDLDRFKQVNDRFGHEAGDRVLLHICQITRGLLREADQFYRFGGEEFIVLMPETALDGAVHLAERIRRAAEETPPDGTGVVTISIGVTEYQTGEPRNSLIHRVDEALYAAKSAGRNIVSAIPSSAEQG